MRPLASLPAVALLVTAAVSSGGIARAATATPPALKMPAIVFKYPKVPEHTSFVIEVNAKGQTTRVRSVARSKDPSFDAIVYGNVIQTFVRDEEGKAVAGVYRMNYDYNPKNQHIRRTVTLVKEGGVDPEARSLVDKMIDTNRLTSEQIEHDLQEAAKEIKSKAKPSPKPSAAATK